ncbi:MAG: TonB-dependent receptor [Marinobacter sp.]|nr:TonB-dependent receptor [Marinobacter sp.]
MPFSRPLFAGLLPGALLSLVALPAQAGNVDAPTLDPLVVTATLGVKTQGESLSSVTVIDEQTIRRQQPREFKDLLIGQPGIDVTGNGSFGKNTSVFMRGTGSESTVFLIDGVRLRSATAGSPPWQYFPPEMIERVEIVRGPRSTLYGSDAVGGVIQAFTHSPADGRRGWVQAGGGSFNTQAYSAGVSGVEGRTRYSVSASHRDTDGTEILAGEGDKGFRNSSGLVSLAHRFDNGGEVGLVVLRAEGNTEFVGGETDFVVQTVGMRLDTPVSDYWRSRIQFAESADEQDNQQGSSTSRFYTKTRSARWENLILAGPHQLIAGGELLVDQVKSSTAYDESSRTNAAVFAQALLNFEPVDLQFSARADDNQAYGRQETGSVALGVAMDDHHRFRVSYGTSFRAPTFNDLYFPGFGNPDVQPEKGGSLEVGVGGQFTNWFWDAVIYQNDVKNLIAFTNVGGVFAPFNVAEARIRGAELSGGFNWHDWTLRASGAVLDPRDRETDNRIRRRSGKQLRVDLDRQLGQFDLGGSVKAQGYRYDDAANQIRLPGFAIVDLRAGWQLTPQWSTRLTVENALDKNYSTARHFSGRNYINAGRMAMLSVRYDFD